MTQDQDKQQEKQPERSEEHDRFAALLKKLVQVPKAEMDKLRKRGR